MSLHLKIIHLKIIIKTKTAKYTHGQYADSLRPHLYEVKCLNLVFGVADNLSKTCHFFHRPPKMIFSFPVRLYRFSFTLPHQNIFSFEALVPNVGIKVFISSMVAIHWSVKTFTRYFQSLKQKHTDPSNEISWINQVTLNWKFLKSKNYFLKPYHPGIRFNDIFKYPIY